MSDEIKHPATLEALRSMFPDSRSGASFTELPPPVQPVASGALSPDCRFELLVHGRPLDDQTYEMLMRHLYLLGAALGFREPRRRRQQEDDVESNVRPA
jgi:hypothetical protein